MKSLRIAELLQSPATDAEVVVKGWVRTKRGNKNVAFIALNDGSCVANMQVVVDLAKFDEELLRKVTTGACLRVDGRLVALPVGADRTDFFIREVVAQFAVFDVAAESVDTACHVAYRIGFHAQQVDRQAQRRAASDAWEFRQFSGHVLKQSGHVLGNFWIRRGGSGFFRWFRTSSPPSSPFCRRRW